MAVITTRFNSRCLGGFVSFSAILPFEDFGDNYMEPNPEPYLLKEKLRTLYLLHGVTGDEKDWLYHSRIIEYATKNRLAVIMPDGNNNFYVDNCETEKWGEFIGNELVQVTRTLFPLSDRREDTFIGGLSMGGYGALRNGLKYNHIFSKIAALSSAIIYKEAAIADEQAIMPWQRKSHYERIFGVVSQIIGSDMDLEYLYQNIVQPVKIFMAVGDKDFLLSRNDEYKEYLLQNNANLTYIVDEGGHEWDFWDRYIEKAIQWIIC